MIPKYKQKKKHSWQNIFFSILLGFSILTITGFLVVSDFRIGRKNAALNSRVEQLRGEIAALQEKKQQLEAKLYQSSQEEYLEQEARENLNLKKPGEEVVTVLPAEEDNTREPQKESFWDKILGK